MTLSKYNSYLLIQNAFIAVQLLIKHVHSWTSGGNIGNCSSIFPDIENRARPPALSLCSHRCDSSGFDRQANRRDILLANSISNGRLFAHTLLFVFFLLLIGTYLYRRSGGEERRIVILGFASLLHLCEDRMWLSPETLFYPLFGFDFPQGVIEEHWWEYFLRCFLRTYSPLTEPFKPTYAFVSELIGMSILLMFIFYKIHTSSGKFTSP